MKILHVLLFCFVSAPWDRHIGPVTAKINVFPNAEGTNGSVICSFGTSEDRKFFCRRECKEEDILVKTDEDSSQNGRYSVKYDHKSSQRSFLTVNIAQLVKSDSGRYRCGLGGSLVPDRYVDFDFKVTDASQSGNTDPTKKELVVHRGVEGNDMTVLYHFSENKNPKFFCKNQCKDGDLLIETSEVQAQKGRYTIKYEDGSAHNSIALFLIITQVTESDSGRYRCGLGSPLSPDNFRDFDIRVGDDPTTSKPSFTTTVTKTTNQPTAPWDRHIDLITPKIHVFPYAEGTNASLICPFGTSRDRKFFCRRECKEEDILVKTNQDSSQNGRYSVKYDHKSSQRSFLTVNIAQLVKSDSGRYRCGLGGSLVPETYTDFDIKVTDASQSGNTDPAKKEVVVYRGAEGNDFTVYCHFSGNKNPKFFCKNQCKDGDLLIETSDVQAQKGRYTIKYEDGSAHNSIALFVTITQVTKSDSGRYRCGLGSPSSPDNFRDFDIRVGDDPTTSKPSFTTTVTKTTNQLTDPTTSKPSFSTSVTKTTNQLTASSDVPPPVFFLPLVVCLPLVASLLAAFLLGLYIRKKRSNFELNARGKAEETAMESLLLPQIDSVETLPAVQP